MIYRKTCALVLSDNLEAVGGQTVVNETVYTILRGTKKLCADRKRLRSPTLLSPRGSRGVSDWGKPSDAINF